MIKKTNIAIALDKNHEANVVRLTAGKNPSLTSNAEKAIVDPSEFFMETKTI
jgi:hypothetical protein